MISDVVLKGHCQAQLSEEKRLAAEAGAVSPDCMGTPRIFRYFKTSPEISHQALMVDARSPQSLQTVA